MTRDVGSGGDVCQPSEEASILVGGGGHSRSERKESVGDAIASFGVVHKVRQRGSGGCHFGITRGDKGLGDW